MHSVTVDNTCLMSNLTIRVWKFERKICYVTEVFLHIALDCRHVTIEILLKPGLWHSLLL